MSRQQSLFKNNKFRIALNIFAIVYFVVTIVWMLKPLRPCGLIGKYIFDSGCVRSFYNGSSVTFLPDGETIVREDFRAIELSPLNYRFWETVRLKHDDFVKETTVSPDGKVAASLTWDIKTGDTLWLWDLNSRTLIRKQNFGPGPENDVSNIAFSADSKELVIVRFLLVELWDIASWESRVIGEGQFTAVVSNDNSVLAVYSDGGVNLIDLVSGQILDTLKFESEYPGLIYATNLAFSPDGAYLAASGELGSLFIWHMADRALQFAYLPYTDDIMNANSSCQLAFSPDSKMVAHCFHTKDDYDGFVRLFNVADGTLVKSFEWEINSTYRPESVSFSPDGELLAVGTPDETMIFRLDE